MICGALHTLAALLLSCATCHAQTAGQAVPASPTPIFDVATIRPNDTGSHSWSIDSDNAYFNGTNVPFKSLLQTAYEIRTDLISGVPDWAESARYDVKAKVVDADPVLIKQLSNEQQTAMFRALLIDRFHLKTHIQAKQLPVYDLVIDKGGAKLQTVVHPTGEDLFHGNGPGSIGIHNGHFIAHAVTLPMLTKALTGQVNRQVVDKTGLTGTYDVLFDFAPDYGNGPSQEATDPPIFTSLQQQLGLKLEPAKGPVDTLVIDHIEKPTAN